MKRFLIMTALLVGVLVLIPATTTCAAKIKIGVIDTQKIMRESKAAKKARTIFLKDLEAKRAVHQAKQQEVRAMDQELKSEGKKMSPSVRKEKGEKLAKEVKELKRLKSDLEEELKKQNLDLTRRLLQEIREIVKEYSKKEKYTIILERRSVVDADEDIDITDKIIRLYDTLR